MTDAGVGSPPPLVGKASLGWKTIGEKKATMRFREGKTLSGSEDEMMPFKKVKGGKWERSVEGSDPIADSVEPTQLDGSAWECADSDGEPAQFEGVVGAHAESFEEPTQLGVVSKKGKERVPAHPNTKHVQPKLRPLKQVEPPAAGSKPASDFGDSDDSGTNNKTPKHQQLKLPKLKPSKPKSKVAKAKEVLKNSQDTIRKAQEEQKRHRRW